MAGFVATVIFVAAFPLYLARTAHEKHEAGSKEGPYFVGRNACTECHKREDDLWIGSHHDLAMDTATDKTVLGVFSNYEFRQNGSLQKNSPIIPLAGSLSKRPPDSQFRWPANACLSGRQTTWQFNPQVTTFHGLTDHSVMSPFFTYGSRLTKS